MGDTNSLLEEKLLKNLKKLMKSWANKLFTSPLPPSKGGRDMVTGKIGRLQESCHPLWIVYLIVKGVVTGV